MKITLHKQGDYYYPYDDEALELTRKKPDGLYVVDIKDQRNPGFHRRAFACFRELYDMVEISISFEEFRRLLTIRAGYYTTVGKVDIQGTTAVAVHADSLAFENMEDGQFRQCFNDILQAFCDKFGKDLTLDQLDNWAMM